MNSPDLLNCVFEVIAGTYEEFILGYVFKNEPKELVESFATHSHQGSIRCISCMNTLIASGGSDEMIQLYNMVTRKEAGTILQHEGTITDLQFTPEQSHLMSCSQDGSVALYRVGNWQLEKVWASAHKGSGVSSIAIHPSSKMALSLGQNNTLRTWNLVKGRPAYTVNLSNLGKQMDLVIWSKEGSYFAVSADTKIYIFNVTVAGIKMTIECTSRVTSMSFFNDTTICFGEESGWMICYSIENESELWRVRVGEIRVKCISCVSEKWLVTGSSDGQIIVWEPMNGRRSSGQQRLRRDYFSRQNNENAEIISYVCESWNKVVKDYRNNGGPYVPGVQSVLYYQPTGSNNRLANFEPFDLESYWGNRVVQKCQNRNS